jgi:hypothetical protein
MKQKLAKALYAKCYELINNGAKDIKIYEVAFQETIELITGDLWWEVTNCNIFMHLFHERDPHKTVTEIINNLKEEYIND